MTRKAIYERIVGKYYENPSQDGVITEFADDVYYPAIIQTAYDNGLKAVVLEPFGMTADILQLDINGTWKEKQVPEIARLKKYLANKAISHIIIDITNIWKTSEKHYTWGWIETYTNYIMSWLKTNYPNIERSLLIRSTVYSLAESEDAAYYLDNLIDKWGISVIDTCEVDSDGNPIDYVPEVPYGTYSFAFYYLPSGGTWLAQKNEDVEDTESESESEDTTEETESDTNEVQNYSFWQRVLMFIKKLFGID